MSAAAQLPSSSGRGHRFVGNVVWNWLGVGATLVAGLIISPYLIRKLGAEGYGIWSLSFALIDYYAFLDLGFRSAMVKYVAHYAALDEPERVNEVLNTILVYAALVAILIFTGCVIGSGYLTRFFNVGPAYAHTFRVLVLLISLSWCAGFVLNSFGAALEALQRFDIYTKANVTTLVVRVSGTLILLYLGYGLISIGVIAVVSQCIGYVLYLFGFRRAFPALRISRRYASVATLRKMGKFGMHTFLANVSTICLNQSPPILIGHFLPAAFVGFYNLPIRLIQYTVDAVGRIGTITNANAAELQARGHSRTLADLATYANRYCFVIFIPVAIVLWIFGDRLFYLWVPAVAEHSAPLLPVLLTGYMVAVVGQFSSAMFLQGLGRHQRYARGLLVEAAAVVTTLWFVVPRYGVMGAAVVAAIAMILNRGVFTPWLVSREMGFSFPRYMNSIYTYPVLTGVPVALFAYWMRVTILPGATWVQLFAAATLIASMYYPLAFFVCVPRHHRALLLDWIAAKVASGKRLARQLP